MDKGTDIAAKQFHAINYNLRRLDHPPARKNMPERIGVSGEVKPMRVIPRDSASRGPPALVGVAQHHSLVAGLATVFGPWLAQPLDQLMCLFVGQMRSHALGEHRGRVRDSFGGCRTGCFVSPRFAYR